METTKNKREVGERDTEKVMSALAEFGYLTTELLCLAVYGSSTANSARQMRRKLKSLVSRGLIISREVVPGYTKLWILTHKGASYANDILDAKWVIAGYDLSTLNWPVIIKKHTIALQDAMQGGTVYGPRRVKHIRAQERLANKQIIPPADYMKVHEYKGEEVITAVKVVSTDRKKKEVVDRLREMPKMDALGKKVWWSIKKVPKL